MDYLRKNLKNITQNNAFQPLFLLVIAALCYGLFIREVGLYWDDFPYTWFGHVLGTTQYHKVFYDERPFLPLLYNITASIFGESIISWQIFAIILRWLCALCAGWLVRLMWKDKKEEAFVVSLLFLVYPGFGQQWVSTIYSRVFILLGLFLLSLIFMVKALRSAHRFWLFTSLSISFGALSILGSEYFSGLELSRPVIIWIIIGGMTKLSVENIKKMGLYWLPYFIGVSAFAVWRSLIVESALYRVKISADPIREFEEQVVDLLKNLFLDAYEGSVKAWLQIFSLPPTSSWNQPYNLITLGLILLVFCLIVGASFSFTKSAAATGQKVAFWHSWQIQSILLGIVMLLAASLPFWAAKLSIDLNFSKNRFTFPMMLGSALLLSGLLFLIKLNWIRTLMLSVLIAFSASWHFQLANTFRQDWLDINHFMQQLTWRIPAIKPGTMLVAYELPFAYYSDNSLTAPINWTYAPDYKEGNLPYYLNYWTIRNESVLENLKPGLVIQQNYRSLNFLGNTSDVIVIDQPKIGCLRILDSVYNGRDTYPGDKYPKPKLIKLSNLDRIITNPETPAQPIPMYFPRPEEKPWCYFYEKAELSRQMGDYPQIVNLWRQANDLSLKPAVDLEYLPFIEGLGMSSETEEALILSKAVLKSTPFTRKPLCNIWDRINTRIIFQGSEKELIDSFMFDLKCYE
jgi:hypothetical protein